MRLLPKSHTNWLSSLGIPKTKEAMSIAWAHCWNKVLTQDRIRAWIERMPTHLAKVIELKGGNEYREGRGLSSIRPYNSEQRKAQYVRRKEGIRPGDQDDVNSAVLDDDEDVWVDVD